MTRQIERIGKASGMLSPLIAIGSITLATILSSDFMWAESALSSLGAPGEPTALLFNGGLIVGGLVALLFGAFVFVSAHNLIEQAGAVVFELTAVSLAAVGVFPAGTPLHFPSAILFYLLLSVSLWVYGIGNIVAGKRLLGAFTVCLGLLNIVEWIVWATMLLEIIPGLALPEIIGALILGLWIFGTALRIET